MVAGQDVKLNINSTLTGPGESLEVSAHDQAFPLEPFSSKEASLFEQQLNDLVADLDSSMLTQVIKMREDVIAKTATLAKHDLEAKSFGGINAGDNQIGFSILRPGHIYSDDSGTIQNNWYFDPDATGWVDWIGDGTTANNYTVDEDQVILVLALVDQESGPTEISGLNVDEFGRNMDMLPRDVHSMRMQDNDTEVQIKQIQTLIGQESDDIHVRLRFDRNVERQPRLFGFNFALGRFLNTEDY